MELLSKRLFRINNIKLIMTDEKISQNKLNQKSIEQNETIPINNNTNNKALINYDKINSLFNQQKDINSINVNNDSNIIGFNFCIRSFSFTKGEQQVVIIGLSFILFL